MSAPRLSRLQKATALVPLALLSAAWTANLTGVGLASASAGSDHRGVLPDGTAVPTEAIQAPASVSSRGAYAPGITGDKQRAIDTASASGIPSVALAAYQRAETVINAADHSCHLPWQLVAAIGRVESDHGRANGNTLTDKGLATPGIYGVPLDGSHGTQAIADTDAGQYDDDAKWDRAVGPMQFIPSTWSVVGVDGDNDGQRNPQDINDAALATAVYLCSGKDDLSMPQGQRDSVYRYNHSHSYVELVLAIMNAYMNGDYTAVPNSVTSYSGGYIVPAPHVGTLGGGHGHGGHHGGHGGGHNGGGGATSGGTTATTPTPTTPPAPTPSNPGGGLPSLPIPTGGGGGGGGGLPTPSLPTSSPLTEAQALAQCIADGVVDNPLTPANELTDCVNKLLNP